MAGRGHRRRLLLLLFVGALMLPGLAPGEIYQWTDRNGRVHFTQDLQRVPAAQRKSAEAQADQKPAESSAIQYFKPASTAPPARRSRSVGASDGEGKTYRIQVQKAGNSMRVRVRINNSLDVPFLIDTGATDVVLPSWAAVQLGLPLDQARTGYYNTANGTISQKLVVLDSVSLGGARVENVSAAVSTTMREGLLGLSYFNHFKSNIDPVAGIVTLQHNNLAETGQLRAGHSAGQWENHFRVARARIRAKEEQIGETPFSRQRLRERRKEELAALESELEKLEREADNARVPFGWRD
jgi:clan AA aspartic protease (TIGR02281 family)